MYKQNVTNWKLFHPKIQGSNEISSPWIIRSHEKKKKKKLRASPEILYPPDVIPIRSRVFSFISATACDTRSTCIWISSWISVCVCVCVCVFLRKVHSTTARLAARRSRPGGSERLLFLLAGALSSFFIHFFFIRFSAKFLTVFNSFIVKIVLGRIFISHTELYLFKRIREDQWFH